MTAVGESVFLSVDPECNQANQKCLNMCVSRWKAESQVLDIWYCDDDDVHILIKKQSHLIEL